MFRLTKAGIRSGLLLAFGILAAAANATFAADAEAQEADALTVRVDPRIELMSVIFRLAGNPEYNNAKVPDYDRAVGDRFAAFAGHEVVQLARKLRADQGISYDAVMSMAIHMTDALVPAERIAFEPFPASLESRWTTGSGREFLAAARRFAVDTDFAGFLREHAALYETSETRLRELLADEAIVAWCKAYFGAAPEARFVIDLGLLNGPGSYGAHFSRPGRTDELHCILGIWKVDDQGLPIFDEKLLPTIVHEFIHSFTNPIVNAHESELAADAAVMYEPVADQMRQQAYGTWQTMLYETLVRGATARWVRDRRGSEAAREQLDWDRSRGFLWMDSYDALLAEYEANRDRYSDYQAFFPRIAAFVAATAKEAPALLAAEEERKAARWRELNAKGPKIVSCVPADGATDVDPALRTLVITFDRPMRDGAWGVMSVGALTPKITGQVSYDETLTIFAIPVELQPGTTYRYGLNAEDILAFQDRDGNPLAPVELSFTTR